MTIPEIATLLHLPTDDLLTRLGNGLFTMTTKRGKFLFTIRQKTEASFHRKTNNWEFGIPLKQAHNYLRYPTLLLLIWESKTSTLWLGSFATLFKRGRIYNADLIDESGTLFVNRCHMKNFTRDEGDGSPCYHAHFGKNKVEGLSYMPTKNEPAS